MKEINLGLKQKDRTFSDGFSDVVETNQLVKRQEEHKKLYLLYQMIFGILAVFSFIVMINRILGNIDFKAQPGWLIIEAVLWLCFFVDYIIRFCISENKKDFFKNNIVDFFAVVPIPGFAIFRVFGLLRVLFTLKRVGRALRSVFVANSLLYMIGAVGIWLFLGAAIMFHFEKGVTMNSYGDAIWCSLVTVCTVGYGDVAPVTAGGRVMAGLMMLTGIGSIGMITSNITANFVVRTKKRNSVPSKNQVIDLSHVSKEKYEKIVDYAKYILSQDEIK